MHGKTVARNKKREQRRMQRRLDSDELLQQVQASSRGTKPIQQAFAAAAERRVAQIKAAS